MIKRLIKKLAKKDVPENRRKHRRKPLVSEIMIYSKDNKKNWGKGFITNINEEGLGLVTTHHLPPEEELLFNFNLPNGWKFDFFGKVIHARKGTAATSYGVKFSQGQGTFIFRLI